MHESTAYDMIPDDGPVEGEIRLLLRQGRKRFGPSAEGKERTVAEYTVLRQAAGFRNLEARRTNSPLDVVLAVKDGK